jgi:hypothetical protein
MRIAVMQPYLFPYIGYWQLLNAVDLFVIFDDVHYIRKGFIDRNSILLNGHPHKIKLELLGASQHKKINEIDVGENRLKLLKTIDLAYRRSIQHPIFYPIVEKILLNPEKNLARYLEFSIMELSTYMKIRTKILRSSSFTYLGQGKSKIIPLVRELGGTTYVNSEGGRALYRAEDFCEAQIGLTFLGNEQRPYAQSSKNFTPNLSVLDLLFNVSASEVSDRLVLSKRE